MAESQNEKDLLKGFGGLFDQFQPYDYYSKLILEILFKVLLQERNAIHLPNEAGQKEHEDNWEA